MSGLWETVSLTRRLTEMDALWVHVTAEPNLQPDFFASRCFRLLQSRRFKTHLSIVSAHVEEKMFSKTKMFVKTLIYSCDEVIKFPEKVKLECKHVHFCLKMELIYIHIMENKRFHVSKREL